MDISPGKILIETLKPGAVYYFANNDFDTDEPHYFVILNKDIKITESESLITVCATSKVDKKKNYVIKRGFPLTTLCILNNSDCNFLSKETVFNGNSTYEFTILALFNKLKSKEIKRIDSVNEIVLGKLRSAVLNSPEVSPAVKNKIK